MPITEEQLAQVLTGIAAAQAAILNATLPAQEVNQKVLPMLRDQVGQISGPLTLSNMYARMVVQSLSPPRSPLADYYAQELQKLTRKS